MATPNRALAEALPDSTELVAEAPAGSVHQCVSRSRGNGGPVEAWPHRGGSVCSAGTGARSVLAAPVAAFPLVGTGGPVRP